MSAVIAHRTLVFRRQPGSDVSMTVRPDGAGTARFNSFRSATGAELSSLVTWKCTTETVRFPA